VRQTRGAKAKGVGQAAAERSVSGPAQLGSELGSADEASRGVFRCERFHLAPRAASPPSGDGEVRGGRAADANPGGAELFGASSRADERSSHAESAGHAEHAAETLWWSRGEGSPAGQQGSEARAEKASEGAAEKAAEHPGEDRPWVGGTPRVTRTDSQEEQGFGAHEASPKERLRLLGPRATGKRQQARGDQRASARREASVEGRGKGVHSRRGMAASAWW